MEISLAMVAQLVAGKCCATRWVEGEGCGALTWNHGIYSPLFFWGGNDDGEQQYIYIYVYNIYIYIISI